MSTQPFELPVLQPSPAAAALPTPAREPTAAWRRAARRARLLSWISLLWMSAEGIGGLWSGLAAGSLGLVAWGLTSTVEGLASAIVIWRFTGARTASATSERAAQQLVALSLFVVAASILVEAVRGLLGEHHVDTSIVGVALTAGAVVVMPLLGRAKRRLAVELGSAATAGEATQNTLCALQSVAVLVSMGLLALSSSLSFVDPVAAGLIAAVAVQEGRATWRGEDCCAVPLPGGGDGCC